MFDLTHSTMKPVLVSLIKFLVDLSLKPINPRVYMKASIRRTPHHSFNTLFLMPFISVKQISKMFLEIQIFPYQVSLASMDPFVIIS